MREKPPSPRALQGTDRMASLLSHHYRLRSLAEQRGMRGPLSSHLGLLRFVRFGEDYPVGAHERTRQV
jgi:hypothetical protein